MLKELLIKTNLLMKHLSDLNLNRLPTFFLNSLKIPEHHHNSRKT